MEEESKLGVNEDDESDEFDEEMVTDDEEEAQVDDEEHTDKNERIPTFDPTVGINC